MADDDTSDWASAFEQRYQALNNELVISEYNKFCEENYLTGLNNASGAAGAMNLADKVGANSWLKATFELAHTREVKLIRTIFPQGVAEDLGGGIVRESKNKITGTKRFRWDPMTISVRFVNVPEAER